MPRSSGGGHHHSSHRSSSHRSSSHRSSSHRSSSSHYRSGRSYYSSDRINSNRISSSFFPGARRYSYTSFGKTRYIYSVNDPAQKFRPARLLTLLFYIPFVLGGIAMAMNLSNPLGKPDSTEIIIKDEADAISSADESELRSVMNQFYKKSGVVPAVITVDEVKWENASSLEDYALTRYLSEFTDEMHWLIVYSDPANEVDWSFEGIQGDDTVSVITYDIADTFNSRLTVNLDTEGSEVGSSISNAFEYIMPKVSKPNPIDRIKSFGPAILLFLFLGFHALIMSGITDLKYKKAKYDPDPDEANQLGTKAAGAAAGIAQNNDTGVNLNGAYNQMQYEQQIRNTYAQGNQGSMQEIGVPAGMQEQNTSYGQSGYQTQYAQNSSGYVQEIYPNGNSQAQNQSYGQNGYQPYGSQNSGYGAQQNAYVDNSSNGYGSYGTQNSSASSYQPYGSNTDGDMPEIGLPQPVPPGCTTCSSCGNVYHVSEGRCNLCGGK